MFSGWTAAIDSLNGSLASLLRTYGRLVTLTCSNDLNLVFYAYLKLSYNLDVYFDDQ